MTNKIRFASRAAAALGAISLCLALPLPAAFAAPTVAAANPVPVVVELSSNGQNNGTDRDAALFDGAILVPGRAESATLVIRNVGPDDGYLVATLADTDLDYVKNEHAVRVFDYISVNAGTLSGGSGRGPRIPEWQVSATAAELADGQRAIFAGTLAAGEEVELAFDIAFYLPPGSDPVIGNQALVGQRAMTFNVHLNLSDPVVVGPGPGPGGITTLPGDLGNLTATGISDFYLIVAGVLFSAGAAVDIKRRRQAGR